MMTFQVRPLDAQSWDDLVTLFGPRGACNGCWCMWWRVTGRQFGANGGAGNKAALRSLMEAGPVGLLAYAGETAVGWAAVAPRQGFGRVLRSPTLKPKMPEEHVWAMPCFFIDHARRHQGVASALLKAAPRFAKSHRASTLEAYPVDVPRGRVAPEEGIFTGTVELFERAGFEVHERPATGHRVIMRRKV